MLAALRFTKGPLSKFDIQLTGAGAGGRPYSPGDRIEGCVSISTGDVSLGRLVVVFQGTSSTGIGQQVSSRSKTEQTFLRLSRTFNPIHYAHSEMSQSHRHYRCPFSFEISTTLPLQACKHRTQSLAVYEAHLRIPPTMGNAYLDPSDPASPRDKLSDSVEIAYTVQAFLLPLPNKPSHAPMTSEIKPIQILPTFDQEPPREGFGSHLYCISKERTFKDRLWSREVGRLGVSVSQPEPLNSSYTSSADLRNPCTTAVLDLNFDQEGTKKPPQLCSLTTRLTAITLYGAVPWESYPDLLVGKVSFADYGRGMDWKVMPISKMCVESVRWIEKPAYSPCDQSSPPHLASQSESVSITQTQRTASIVVPITAPQDTYLVPSFHSCLISRVYLLDFSLSYKQSDAQIFTSSLCLRVPIQVIVQ